MPQDSEAQPHDVRAMLTVGPIDSVTVVDGLDGDQLLTLRLFAGTSTIDIIGPMRGERVAGGPYVPGLADLINALDQQMRDLARPDPPTPPG